jgi:hypothetical protein
LQRCTSVNTHNLRGFLKLTLTGLVVISIKIIIIFILVTATSGPVFLLLGLAAVASPAAAFLAGPFSTVLGSLLISFLILSILLLDKLFDSSVVLEVMALGAMDLAILLVGTFRLVGRQGLTVGTPGNFLAGGVSLSHLGRGDVAGLFGGKQGFAFVLLAVPPPTSPYQGNTFGF